MTNWNRTSYTKEEFTVAWNESPTIAKCLEKLNLRPTGGNYKSVKSIAKSEGLSDEHMTGQSWSKGLSRPGLTPRQELVTILVENSTYKSTTHLRKRLISEKILPGECSAPHCPFKSTKPLHPFTGEEVVIKLELDHINGVNTDNRIENLRILCSFCHSYTVTWRGSNIKK